MLRADRRAARWRRELRAVLGQSSAARPTGATSTLPPGPPPQPARAHRPRADGRGWSTPATGDRVLVAYADCGTGGAARPVARRPARRPAAGRALLRALRRRRPVRTPSHDAEPGTFYLTDFLAKHFDALVWQGLGLDRHPELRDHVLRPLPARRAGVAARRRRGRAGGRARGRRASGWSSSTVPVGLGPFAEAVAIGPTPGSTLTWPERRAHQVVVI